MEGGNRAEAERWLYTANKLLSARDLHGARSFAIRARECDPRFEVTELLLTVIDTLVAGEARINDLVDWYSILQVIRYSHNLDYIAAQYRRLAAILDPHRNPFAFSAYAFSLVNDAWSVLSNPSKKAIFDNDLRLLTEPPPPPPSQPAPVPIVPQAFPILQQRHNLNNHQNNHNQSHDLNQNQNQNHFLHQNPNQNQNHLINQNQQQRQRQQQQQQQQEEERQRQKQEEERQRQQQEEERQRQQQEEERQRQQQEEERQRQQQEQEQQKRREQEQALQLQRQQQEQEQWKRQQQEQAKLQLQRQQQQQQQLFSLSKNAISTEAPRVVVVEEEEEEERPSQDNVTQLTEPTRPARATESIETELNGAFWTACPYCYGLFEYPKVYEECTLLCQSCRRPFHALAVRSPPELTGKDGFMSFCSWGFMPLGFSGDFKDISGSASQWNPFSALVPCPLKGADRWRHLRGPWAYYDDEAAAAFVEHSDTTEDDSDDEDWRNINANKKVGRKRRRRRNRKSSATTAGGNASTPVERPRRGVRNRSGNAGVENGEAVGADSAAVPIAARLESGKKAALASLRRRGAGNLGKLDLNVEFSNDVEETANGVRDRANAGGTGNAEDNIEGIGFFEGLDEFLSSLPILNAVADDKVKGH
ncbi:uncharacterized protein LOC130954493 [Arachis stenosperma]|uniref:uncharacterized protein LOC130954493 n=1 Tax=Arachis stenosperma TaxID=217475 RepID=UPI0025AB63E7|nr:uncharacterized protein LOC130954493 [Arachis stenosperma]